MPLAEVSFAATHLAAMRLGAAAARVGLGMD